MVQNTQKILKRRKGSTRNFLWSGVAFLRSEPVEPATRSVSFRILGMRGVRLWLAAALFLSSCAVFKPIHKNMAPMQMVPIPAGTFKMGDFHLEENEDALPLHTVALDSFWLGRYEVTYAQLDAWRSASGLPPVPADEMGRGGRAAVYVTWDEAAALCEAYGLRLPSEQEWEYAARSGGQAHPYSGGLGDDELNEISRNPDNSAPYTMAPGLKRPNALGLYDMTGNAFEWIGAYYPYYKTEPDSLQWYDLQSMGMRVIRGGSFRERPETLSTYWRVAVLREERFDDLGFRCAGDPVDRPHRRVVLVSTP